MILRWLLVAGLGIAAALVRALAFQGARGAELVSLGLLLLGGILAGDLAERFKLPRVTGYLLIGMALGPSVLGAVPSEDVERLRLFEEVALGLIALTAGGEFSWRVIRSRWRLLFGIAAAHTLGLGIGVAALSWLALSFFPLIGPLDGAAKVAAALLIGVVTVAKSPATTIAVITETRSRGDVVDVVLGVTVLKDLVLLLVFAVVFGLALRWTGAPTSGSNLGSLVLEVAASLGVGTAVGIGLGAYLRWIRRHTELLVIALALLASVMAEETHLEPLLLCMAAGFTARNLFPTAAEPFLHALERASPPLYLVFFALVGAGLPLQILEKVGPAAVVLAAVRLLGIWIFTWTPAIIHRAPPAFRRWGWTGFVAQAGLSLGLASRIRAEVPGFGPTLATLIIGAVLINQFVGPILWRWGLSASGETGAADR